MRGVRKSRSKRTTPLRCISEHPSLVKEGTKKRKMEDMSKIEVILKPKSKEQKIEKLTDNAYKVCVKALPIKGAANKELLEVLSEHFEIPKSQIKIISGWKSRRKIVGWEE